MRSPQGDLANLAVFGGEPCFAVPRHVGRPNIGDPRRIMSLISGSLQSRWLTNDGPLVDEFETRVAELCGAAQCVAVCNATAGLQLTAAALLGPGDVVMPSFTFVGTAHAMRWIGLRPVFCEIDPETHTVDPAAAERTITPHTRAIVGVHLWGNLAHASALDEVAQRAGLPLLFDAAHALGYTTGLGVAEVVSLHATKVASAGEGGAVLTQDRALADRLRRMRNFGFTDYDEVGMLGTNAKMSELSAAMGIASLESFDRFVAVNRRNAAAYKDGLAGLPGVRLQDHGEHHNHHYIVIEVPAELRDDLVSVLQAENIFARRYFHPGCHRHEPYRRDAVSLPLTEAVCARVVTLPTGTAMSEADVARVCGLVRLVVDHMPELQRRLRD